MAEAYISAPDNKFTFGLWTACKIGRDPFGEPVRAPKSPAEIVELLGEIGGVYGVNFHDNDLIPIDATVSETAQIKAAFRKPLRKTGIRVPMATTNLFSDPVFKDGAVTSNDAEIRAHALHPAM